MIFLCEVLIDPIFNESFWSYCVHFKLITFENIDLPLNRECVEQELYYCIYKQKMGAN